MVILNLNYDQWFVFQLEQEIPLDRDTVRLFVRIVKNRKHGRQIQGFSRIYFDGKYNYNYARYFDVDYDCSSVVYGPIITDDGVTDNSNDDDDDDEVVFYSDFGMALLRRWFGNKLENGISPRVRGLTVNGNEFYCCGGYDCVFYSNYEKKPLDQPLTYDTTIAKATKIREYTELPLCRGVNVVTSVEYNMNDLYEYIFERQNKKNVGELGLMVYIDHVTDLDNNTTIVYNENENENERQRYEKPCTSRK